MSLQKRIDYVTATVQREVYSLLPIKGVERPIFIVGCGRSGTTIFGKALSKHHRITYLNEPRTLWVAAYPETDIWTKRAALRRGKLALTAADADLRKSRRLKRLLHFEIAKTKKPILIEKLPANNFRLELIATIFPDARFIHIYRNGLEVARSIENVGEKDWFGANSYKWERLVDYALGSRETASLPSLCADAFDRGLLEWRLSTEAVVEFLGKLGGDAFCELSYDELNRHPVETLARVLRFVGVRDDLQVTRFVSETVHRKTGEMIAGPLSDKEKILGGRLLPLSMTREKGLTRGCF